MKEKVNIEIYEQILKLNNILNDIDIFEENISKTHQHIDLKISDLYHKLEDMQLTAKSSYRFCRELKEVLSERRKFKNNLIIYDKYKKLKNKMMNGIDNRKLALAELSKEVKNLNNQYKPRVYEEQELNKIIEG